jgi:hypothetical protein
MLIRPQACFTNSTEVLFGVLTFYQLRVVERLWGSRKFAVSPQSHMLKIDTRLTFTCSPSSSQHSPTQPSYHP